ncbi:MAG TPA: hypothetical protein PKD54_13505, partial [Pirellulaceae bacterium]|nr:hypothetical protein [Pirellulaceae bacterium]
MQIHEIKECFLAALEIEDLTERQAFLDRACGAEGPVRAEVDRLIRAHTGANGLWEPSVELQALTARQLAAA